jgi:hypothetical protein
MPNFTVGDTVIVRGYGGYATVINMEADGYTPQGKTKWLCTVRFGPYQDPNTLVVDLPFGPVRKGARDRFHQFYSGRLTNIEDEAEVPDKLIAISAYTLKYIENITAAEVNAMTLDELRMLDDRHEQLMEQAQAEAQAEAQENA